MRGWSVPAALLSFFAAAAPPVAAFALTGTTPMTLPDAVAYALDHSSTIAGQRAAVTQAQHALALQRGVAYPTVNGTLQSFLAKSANFQGGFAVIGAQQQNVVSQNTAQLGITNWNVTTGGFSFLQLAAARAQEAQAANTLANGEDQIATNVTNSFYTIVQRQAIVIVDLLTLKYQNDLVDVAKLKEKAGVAAGVDVLQAKTSAAKSESSLVADRASVQDASESLAQQIGAPILTPFATPTSVPEPPIPHGTVDTLVAIAQSERPDVAAAREAVLAARFTRRSWNVELYPQVAVSAAIGNQYSPTSTVELQSEVDQNCLLYHQVPCPIVPRGSPGFGRCRPFPPLRYRWSTTTRAIANGSTTTPSSRRPKVPSSRRACKASWTSGRVTGRPKRLSPNSPGPSKRPPTGSSPPESRSCNIRLESRRSTTSCKRSRRHSRPSTTRSRLE